ncbi:hypothetical protein [Rhodanobacter sp. DHB23]|uniref:hypothetical protein n=1 Tax=Rhodanobacter sp. DHB23 TaxID=2775923 RepID=UPI00177E9624|nr:hypothetical protein [Rhodanobacter sp. DHB23]MBD8871837.1 hypothetical protein [Rhodanobacter sp. DHB23]
MEVSAIYGYEFTKPFFLNGFEFIPRYEDAVQAHDASRSRDFNLTGWVYSEVFGDVLPFRLAAVLSFIERMKVVISDPIVLLPSFKGDFVDSISGGLFERSSGGGAVLIRDCIDKNSRPDFIRKAMSAFDNLDIAEKCRFPELIFSCVESFSLSRPLIEIQYFLLFSSLEMYARSITRDSSPRLPRIISKALNDHGFDVSKKHQFDSRKSISTYTDFRNALFHNGRRFFVREEGGVRKYFRLNDYIFNIAQLVALLVLKVVDFDDGHINWNSWLDRQAFK